MKYLILFFLTALTFSSCHKKMFPGYTMVKNPVRPNAEEQTVVGKFFENGTFLGQPSDYIVYNSYDSIKQRNGFSIDTVGLKAKIGSQIEAELGLTAKRVRVASVDSIIYHVAKDYSKFSLKQGITIVVSAAIVVKKFTLEASDAGSLNAVIPTITNIVSGAKVSIQGNRADVRSGQGLVAAVQVIKVISEQRDEQNIGWVMGVKEIHDGLYKNNNYIRLSDMNSSKSSLTDSSLRDCLNIEFTSGSFLESGSRRIGKLVYCPPTVITYNLDKTMETGMRIVSNEYRINIPTRILGVHTPPKEIIIYELLLSQSDVAFYELKNTQNGYNKILGDTSKVSLTVIGTKYTYEVVKAK